MPAIDKVHQPHCNLAVIDASELTPEWIDELDEFLMSDHAPGDCLQLSIFYEAPDGGMLAADWAEGFMDAFGLRIDAWDALFEDENGRMLMGPIMAQLHDKEGEPFIDGSLEEMQEIGEECAQSLPYAIKGMHEFWKARRQPAKRPNGKKVGRNELFPCGSGRKYKRCCGAS